MVRVESFEIENSLLLQTKKKIIFSARGSHKNL